jgi:hypothetical protein
MRAVMSGASVKARPRDDPRDVVIVGGQYVDVPDLLAVFHAFPHGLTVAVPVAAPLRCPGSDHAV